MNRRCLCIVVAALCFLLVGSTRGEAQQAEKVYRIGILRPGPIPSPMPKQKSPIAPSLKELGWVEGKNLVYEIRYGESADQLKAAAAELIRLKVDVLLADSCGLAKIL